MIFTVLNTLKHCTQSSWTIDNFFLLSIGLVLTELNSTVQVVSVLTKSCMLFIFSEIRFIPLIIFIPQVLSAGAVFWAWAHSDCRHETRNELFKLCLSVQSRISENNTLTLQGGAATGRTLWREVGEGEKGEKGEGGLWNKFPVKHKSSHRKHFNWENNIIITECNCGPVVFNM